jgi:hypothetical protein
MDVVSGLCQDTSPIDGVDCTKVVAVVEFSVAKESLDNILAIVKSTFDS